MGLHKGFTGRTEQDGPASTDKCLQDYYDRKGYIPGGVQPKKLTFDEWWDIYYPLCERPDIDDGPSPMRAYANRLNIAKDAWNAAQENK
jgi:hypothetical protein